MSEASLLSESSWLVLGGLTVFEEAEMKPKLAVDNLVSPNEVDAAVVMMVRLILIGWGD